MNVWVVTEQADINEDEFYGVFTTPGAVQEAINENVNEVLSEDPDMRVDRRPTLPRTEQVEFGGEDHEVGEWRYEPGGTLWGVSFTAVFTQVNGPTNWQDTHPGVCCACGTQMSTWSPENPPICFECHSLVNEEA